MIVALIHNEGDRECSVPEKHPHVTVAWKEGSFPLQALRKSKFGEDL